MSFELARQEIERHVKVYKAFQEAEHALVALASLEQHTKELAHSKSILEASIKSLTSDIKSKQNRLSELEERHTKLEQLVEESLIETEKQKLFELNHKFDNLKVIKEKELEELSNKIIGLEVKVTGHDTYVRSKQQELELLESKITAAKLQMQRMLNGSV